MDFDLEDSSYLTADLLGKPEVEHHYLLLYSNDQGCQFTVGEKNMILPPCTFIFLPINTKISRREEDKRPFVCVYFSADFFNDKKDDLVYMNIQALFEASNTSYKTVHLAIDKRSHIAYIFEQIRIAQKSKVTELYRELGNNAIRQLLLTLALADAESNSVEELDWTGEQLLIKEFLMLLESEVKVHKQVTYYAESLNVTTKKLTRLTKSFKNKSPKELILEEMMRQSIQLLLHSTKSIKQVAWEMGYEEENNFSTVFVKECGLRPSAFRKKNRGMV